jgi:hypothetical protein
MSASGKEEINMDEQYATSGSGRGSHSRAIFIPMTWDFIPLLGDHLASRCFEDSVCTQGVRKAIPQGVKTLKAKADKD